MDLAVVSKPVCRVPYLHGRCDRCLWTSNKIGVLKDSNGKEVQVMANEVTVNKNSGLAYATVGESVYVIDIKDPYNPLLLNKINAGAR